MTKYIKNEIYPIGKNLYYKTWISHQTVLFGIFVFFIVFLGAIYIYFAADIVIQAADRGVKVEKLGALEQEYRGLEKKYLSLIQNFNLDRASSLGFVAANNSSTFLTRTSRLSQNTIYEKATR